MSDEMKETTTTELTRVEPVAASVLAQADTSFLERLQQDLPTDIRREVVRESAPLAIQTSDSMILVVGELLYEIQVNEYYKAWTFTDPESGETRNYKSFEEYISNELDFERGKAHGLIGIYRKFVVELGIPTEELADLKWSKAREVMSLVTAENWPDIVEKCRTMSLKEIKDWAKAERGATRPSSSGKKAASSTVSMSFKLHPDQAENIRKALEVAKELTGSDSPANQLDMIAGDFITGTMGMDLEAGTLPKLDLIVATIERTMGVKLQVVSVDADKVGK
jgi:hypothetical protein